MKDYKRLYEKQKEYIKIADKRLGNYETSYKPLVNLRLEIGALESEPDIDDFITQEKVNEWIDTVERRTEEIISSNPYSINPSRLEGYQFREAIRFLAKQIDTLHNLRIQSWKTKTNA